MEEEKSFVFEGGKELLSLQSKKEKYSRLLKIYRTLMVFFTIGFIVIFMDFPCSFQVPSLFDPLTLNVYWPGLRLIWSTTCLFPRFIQSLSTGSNL